LFNPMKNFLLFFLKYGSSRYFPGSLAVCASQNEATISSFSLLASRSPSA